MTTTATYAEIRVSNGEERWCEKRLAPAGWYVLLSSPKGPIAYVGPYASRNLAAGYVDELGIEGLEEVPR